MASTTVKVKGLRELGEAMRGLSNKIARKVAFQAVLAGTTVIRKRAVELAPESDEPHKLEGVVVNPGNLKKNIVTKRRPKSKLTAEYVVTVRGKRKDGYASRYGRLQEFGTVNHPPQPFLRPAFDQEKGFAVRAIKDKLTQAIEKAKK